MHLRGSYVHRSMCDLRMQRLYEGIVLAGRRIGCYQIVIHMAILSPIDGYSSSQCSEKGKRVGGVEAERRELK